MPSLEVEALRIDVSATRDDIVDDVSFSIEAGQVLGIVGESGSGKTTVGLATLAHSRRGATIASGRVLVNGKDILALDAGAVRSLRGSVVSYVPQDPGAALNPAMRIGPQILEVLEVHNFGTSAAERTARLRETMRDVALPDDDEFLRRYPHQLSGGQQQRVGLAMAFACRPAVIVLDEPTTGLDVSTQDHVLATIRQLCAEHGVAALYVTHDLAVVANLADRVAVMYAGRIVEHGPASTIFAEPAHPYTRHLLAAVPDMSGAQPMVGLGGRAPAPGGRPTGCSFAVRCELVRDECTHELPPLREVTYGHSVRCVAAFEVPVSISSAHRVHDEVPLAAEATTETPALELTAVNASYSGVRVVHDVSLSIARGACLALVGESGSGKSTLSKSIGGLHREWTGTISVAGHPLQPAARDRTTAHRLAIQYVFQNPYQSLNPRRTVGESIARPLAIAGADRSTIRSRVGEMLDRVSLTAGYANKYPDQLSGGERQRCAIARGLISQPDVLICDEVTSALDVLVQAAIIDLLAELQRDLGLSMLFVTHNLPVVREIADHVAVLSAGRIVELGTAQQVLTEPQHEYTVSLLQHTPTVPRA